MYLLKQAYAEQWPQTAGTLPITRAMEQVLSLAKERREPIREVRAEERHGL